MCILERSNTSYKAWYSVASYGSSASNLTRQRLTDVVFQLWGDFPRIQINVSHSYASSFRKIMTAHYVKSHPRGAWVSLSILITWGSPYTRPEFTVTCLYTVHIHTFYSTSHPNLSASHTSRYEPLVSTRHTVPVPYPPTLYLIRVLFHETAGACTLSLQSQRNSSQALTCK